MTTLVAVQGQTDVLLGWDSLCTWGNEVGSMANPKFFVNNGVVYGVAGLARAIDVLQFADLPRYEPPKESDSLSRRRWLVREWTPALREAIEEEPGLMDGEGYLGEWMVMVVVDGEAFMMDSLLNVGQTDEGIYTAGSGGDFARGALEVGATVREALGVAAKIDPGTGGELTVKWSKDMVAEYEKSSARIETHPDKKEINGFRQHYRLRRSG